VFIHERNNPNDCHTEVRGTMQYKMETVRVVCTQRKPGKMSGSPSPSPPAPSGKVTKKAAFVPKLSQWIDLILTCSAATVVIHTKRGLITGVCERGSCS
jgi:hypothetical protein